MRLTSYRKQANGFYYHETYTAEIPAGASYVCHLVNMRYLPHKMDWEDAIPLDLFPKNTGRSSPYIDTCDSVSGDAVKTYSGFGAQISNFSDFSGCYLRQGSANRLKTRILRGQPTL